MQPVFRALGHRVLAIFAGSSTLYFIKKDTFVKFIDEKELYIVILSIYMLIYELLYQIIRRRFFEDEKG